MNYTAAEIDDRLKFFAELLSYDGECYLWDYDTDGSLLSSNCPYPVLDTLFRRHGCCDCMIEYMKDTHSPLMMTSEFGIIWGVLAELKEEQILRFHVLGPAFTKIITQSELEASARGKIPAHWMPKFLEMMGMIPVVSEMMFSNRILMMQYCINGERLEISDIEIQQIRQDTEKPENREYSPVPDRSQIHMSEQSLLNMIRNGDLNYHSELANDTGFLAGKERLSSYSLQNARLEQIQFIAMCCSAAIEGGLPAETAYKRKDAYVHSVDSAGSLTEITRIGKVMYADYIQLVYNQITNLSYSKAVQSTCDYISNHLGDDLAVGILADRVGYSAYYLSRIFKKETGSSIDEYTRNARIEKAKMMLTSSRESIQSISDTLGFSGRNYFAVTFKKVTGMPPAAYRKKYQLL